MDSQQVEIVGRNILVSSLVTDGLEVAEPLRDHGVDLIAYDDVDTFHAAPIQLKSLRKQSFGIWKKYERFDELWLAFVWGVENASTAEIFCLSHRESVAVAHELGWTKTDSWTVKGAYSTQKPSARVKEQLEPFRMQPGAWRKRLAL